MSNNFPVFQSFSNLAICVLGQAGKKGGMLDGMHSLIPGWNDYINDDVTESPAYLVGQVACGIAFPYATLARDFTADMLRGDYAGAALNSLGYLGKVRTLLGTTDVIPLFIAKNVAKNPQKIDSGQEIMSHLWKQGIYHTELPAIEKAAMLDKAFDGAATRLNGQGVADDVVAGIYENNGNIERTLKATKSDTGTVRTLWLEEGKLSPTNGGSVWREDKGGSGWLHIWWNHISKPTGNDFEKALGSNYQHEEQIKQLVIDAARYGTEGKDSAGRLYRLYEVPNSGGKNVLVGIGDNGYIVSARPM